MSSPETILAAARVDAEARVAALEAQLAGIVDTASASSGDDEHDPEGQTIAFDRAQVDALRAAARHDLAEIDAARGRLAAGTYGICEGAGARSRPNASRPAPPRGPAWRACRPGAERI